MEYNESVQQIAIDLLNTLRWIALIFSQEYTNLAEEIDTNIFDIGFYQFAQWFLVITGVGMVSTSETGPTSIASQIRSLVRGLKIQGPRNRYHKDYADGAIDSAVNILTVVLGDPVKDEDIERDEDEDLVYTWVAYTFCNVVSICVETYPYNSQYHIHILDHTGLHRMLAKYWTTQEKRVWADHQNPGRPDEYGIPADKREHYDAEMAVVVADLESAQAIKDWSDDVPYGNQSYKLESHYDAVLEELEIQETDRYCVHSTTLSPYASILENVQDAETQRQMQILWTEVDTSTNAHVWTYP